MQPKETVLVGMSGGVDSAATALLLQQAGYQVIGVTMKIWKGQAGDKAKYLKKNSCYGSEEKEDLKEAQRICELLKIPFYVLDCTKQFEKIVLNYFKSEYLAGRTPNPCIQCNSQIKFKALPELALASDIHFDKFATGHYARLVFDEKNHKYLIKTALDTKKDQTYFLYRLTQSQLAKILFPLGNLLKTDIKKIAVQNKIHEIDKEESQDFYSGDYNDLLNIPPQTGNIIDTEGNILGKHQGFWNYTIGQRKGLKIANVQPLYVISLNQEKNEVVVGYENETYSQSLTASELNWLIEPPKNNQKIYFKIRSSQTLQEGILKICSEKKVMVEFKEPQKAVTPGQSIAIYQNDILLGGGIINL